MTAIPNDTRVRWHHLVVRSIAGGVLPFLALGIWWSTLGFSDGAMVVSALLWPIWILLSLLRVLACNLSPWFRRITYSACLLCLAVALVVLILRRL